LFILRSATDVATSSGNFGCRSKYFGIGLERASEPHRQVRSRRFPSACRGCHACCILQSLVLKNCSHSLVPVPSSFRHMSRRYSPYLYNSQREVSRGYYSRYARVPPGSCPGLAHTGFCRRSTRVSAGFYGLGSSLSLIFQGPTGGLDPGCPDFLALYPQRLAPESWLIGPRPGQRTRNQNHRHRRRRQGPSRRGRRAPSWEPRSRSARGYRRPGRLRLRHLRERFCGRRF
jgi:hypothetical protein